MLRREEKKKSILARDRERCGSEGGRARAEFSQVCMFVQ
jgi:hypothetical protein